MIKHLFKVIEAHNTRKGQLKVVAHKAEFWWDIEEGHGVTVFDANGNEALSWSQYHDPARVQAELVHSYRNNREGYEDLRDAVLLESVDAMSKCRYSDEVIGICRVLTVVVDPVVLN